MKTIRYLTILGLVLLFLALGMMDVKCQKTVDRRQNTADRSRKNQKPARKIAQKRAMGRFYAPPLATRGAEGRNDLVRYVSLAGGGVLRMPIYMPAAGWVSGAFSADDRQTDLDRSSAAYAGGGILQYNEPGNVEVMVMDCIQASEFARGRAAMALWSSAPSRKGSWRVYVGPGNYELVISNRDNYLMRKSVRLDLYEAEF